MVEHTSRRLELDEDAPECSCGHPDDRHNIQWISRTFPVGEVTVVMPTPIVDCIACISQSIAAQRLANRHGLAIAQALQATRPEFAAVVRMLEAGERLLSAHDAGAPASELAALKREHEARRQEVVELQLLTSIPPWGEA